MLQEKKKKRIRLLSVLAVIFCTMFLGRFVYQLYFTGNDVVISYSDGITNYSESSRKITNVATDRISKKDYSGQEIHLDQKYEKTADMSATTFQFQNDNKKIRDIAEKNKAVIQLERLSGLPGKQTLDIAIGVSPELFDGMVERLREIGTITSFAVNKVDKTDEFRALTAETETLKKTRDSYLALKAKGDSVQDMLLLEDKILQVEKSIQELGVDLGVYSTENSFCTVNVKLTEVFRKEISLRFVLRALKDSFLWSLFVFTAGFFLFAVIYGCAALVVELSFYFRKRRLSESADGGSE